jgi:hypothetical protein
MSKFPLMNNQEVEEVSAIYPQSYPWVNDWVTEAFAIMSVFQLQSITERYVDKIKAWKKIIEQNLYFLHSRLVLFTE